MDEVDRTLRDGRVAHLRAVTPADEAEAVQLFSRLSDEARYMRYMSVVHVPDVERCDEARRRGLKQMDGFVLAQNQPMLGLARRLGFRIEAGPGDPSVRICRLNLDSRELA